MKNTNWVWSVMFGLAFGAVATAQDSVGKRSCEPDAPFIDKVGDAVDPWDDGATNEQKNDYVVDLVPFQTSWNTTFGIAPIIKSSKTNEDFYGSLTSAQAISRLHRTGVSLGAGYPVWNGPGFGVNNDATKNDVPSIVDTSCLTGNQFAVMFAEFSTTDVSNSYNAIVGGIVRYVPTNPERLYVSRIMAAINGCDNAANVSQFGIGGIDEFGNLHFRADGDTANAPDPVAPACGLSIFPVNDLIPPAEANQNVFRVNLAGRDPTKRNVISNDFVGGGQFDKGTLPPTTEWLVKNSAVSHNTPNGGPQSVFGSSMLLDSNFNNELVTGTSVTSATTAHLNAVVTNGARGNVGYTSKNCTNLASTHGIGGILGKDDPTFTQVMNLFGLGAGASITGTKGLVLPADVFDNIPDPGPGASFGLTMRNAPGNNEHDHYHSQVAFRGGNGQIALGTDQAGNLLAAAHVNHPDSSNGLAHEFNYIVVAKVNCSTGTTTWTMAGYNFNGNFGVADPNARIGKAILNGPAGSTIARMTTLDRVTGGAPLGPSVSAPMIDSVGNVYFVSAIEMCPGGVCDGSTGPFTNALLRAVYDTAAFGYRLELVFKLGDVFHGKNSDRDYLVSFTGIADNNSVDSGTAWSGNISEVAHMNGSTAGLMTKDSRTLGGLVLAAEIIYDVDDDGDFDECDLNGGTDQDYNVLLYIGALDAPDCVGDSECVDCDPCTRDRCLPGDTLANGVGCVNFESLYGDISPAPFGDGVVDLDDLLCVLAGFANFLDCTLSDISPCPTGEGNLVDLDDLLLLLNAFAGEPSCCDLMR